METKSISRLLSLLELGGQTALVRIYPAAELSSNSASGWSHEDTLPASSAAPWYADLHIQAGQLQYGAVFSSTGERRLVGQQALDFLGRIGALSYELLPLPAPPNFPPSRATPQPLSQQPPGSGTPYALPERPRFPASPPSPDASWRPIRTRWGDFLVQDPQRLSRDERRVLSLINGQRTIDELSRLLGFSFEALSKLLAYFRDQNLIS